MRPDGAGRRNEAFHLSKQLRKASKGIETHENQAEIKENPLNISRNPLKSA